MHLDINDKHLDEISSIETAADVLIQKNTFEHTLSALDMYANAQQHLDKTIDADPKLKDDVNYRLWKEKLVSKINNASSILASPKLKSYEA